MNLQQYTETFLGVLNQCNAETQLHQASLAGNRNEETLNKEILEAYDWIIKELRQAISQNKSLLGIFSEDHRSEGAKKKILGKEIHKEDLLRHILKVRMDIRYSLEEKGEINESEKVETAQIVLLELSNKLGLQKLGPIFGQQEKAIYKNKFPQKKNATTDRDPIAEKLKKRWKDPHYRALMEKLVKERNNL